MVELVKPPREAKLYSWSTLQEKIQGGECVCMGWGWGLGSSAQPSFPTRLIKTKLHQDHEVEEDTQF
jgi:hypothetical protein